MGWLGRLPMGSMYCPLDVTIPEFGMWTIPWSSFPAETGVNTSHRSEPVSWMADMSVVWDQNVHTDWHGGTTLQPDAPSQLWILDPTKAAAAAPPPPPAAAAAFWKPPAAAEILLPHRRRALNHGRRAALPRGFAPTRRPQPRELPHAERRQQRLRNDREPAVVGGWAAVTTQLKTLLPCVRALFPPRGRFSVAAREARAAAFQRADPSDWLPASYPLWAGFTGVKWVAVIEGNTGSVRLSPHAIKNLKRVNSMLSKTQPAIESERKRRARKCRDTCVSAAPPGCRNSLWLLSTSADAISPCFRGCSGASRGTGGNSAKLCNLRLLRGRKARKASPLPGPKGDDCEIQLCGTDSVAISAQIDCLLCQLRR